jgi:hypothetical protein
MVYSINNNDKLGGGCMPLYSSKDLAKKNYETRKNN